MSYGLEELEKRIASLTNTMLFEEKYYGKN